MICRFFGQRRVGSASRRVLCWVLSFALVLQTFPVFAFAHPPRRSGRAAIPSPYPPFLIGPGDMLSVTVYGEKDLPDKYLVDSSGTIEFPLIGEIILGSLTQVEASRALTHALSKYLRNPQVTVLVTDSAQYTVAVMGNVVKPGKYLIRGLPTLLGALAQAGGPLANSALNSVVLIRDNKSIRMPLNVYFEPGNIAQSQPLIYPGDVLYVPVSPWPTFGEWAIVASLLTSAAVLAEAVYQVRH